MSWRDTIEWHSSPRLREAVRLASETGDPFRQLAPHRPVTHKALLIRVTRVGWYGPNGEPVVLGQKFRLPAPDAHGLIALGRCCVAQ